MPGSDHSLQDVDNTCRFVDHVRGCGARVALDDFGAGYASFTYVKKLKSDRLEIDGSCIQDPATAAFVALIAAPVALAHPA